MNIVYYNSESFLITQLSPVIDKHSLDPYIVLDAKDQELLEKNKFIPQRFTVQVIDQEKNIGKLVEVNKNFNVTTTTKIEKFFLVPYHLPSAEIVLKQHTSNKTIEIFSNVQIARSDSFSKMIVISACVNNDPYWPLWFKIIDAKELSSGPTVIEYQGSDNFRLYVFKTFNSYSHEL
jgi:hypothetical protein